MSKKKITKVIRLQIEAGKANPAPPVGPVLGAAGVNIMGFCKEFNAKTQGMPGMVLPVIISVYADRTFSFELRKPPISNMILRQLKIEKGSAVPNRDKVGRLTRQQVIDIAKEKAPDLNCRTLESAIQMVCGTARSMGVDVEAGVASGHAS